MEKPDKKQNTYMYFAFYQAFPLAIGFQPSQRYAIYIPHHYFHREYILD
jgi:hypothetical protein